MQLHNNEIVHGGRRCFKTCGLLVLQAGRSLMGSLLVRQTFTVAALLCERTVVTSLDGATIGSNDVVFKLKSFICHIQYDSPVSS